ncbi:hypothetical protein NLI96_g5664 [Meripilus lineatus]|uniref:Uncharacterized protein n=1 Tax=Meripilus lineatus TaxID=2056292 RepID=A0AAD5YGQ5_9APHY|nr:hypothetical protein NLI96_g5664 [Physisporinus lineatus]
MHTTPRTNRQAPDNSVDDRHVDPTRRWVQNVRRFEPERVEDPPTDNWSGVPAPSSYRSTALPWTYNVHYGIRHHMGQCPCCEKFFRHQDDDSGSVSFQMALAKKEDHFNTRVEVARRNEESATAEVSRLRQVTLTLEAELAEMQRERDVSRERILMLQQQVRILERDPSAMVVDPMDPPPRQPRPNDLENRLQDTPNPPTHEVPGPNQVIHYDEDDVSSDDPYYADVFASEWEETEEDRMETAKKAVRNADRAARRAQRRAAETPEQRAYRLETKRIIRFERKEREKEFPRSGKRIPKHLRGSGPLPESFWEPTRPRRDQPNLSDDRGPSPQAPRDPRSQPAPYLDRPPIGHAPTTPMVPAPPYHSMVAGPPARQFSSYQRAPPTQPQQYISFYPNPPMDQSSGASMSRRGYRPGQISETIKVTNRRTTEPGGGLLRDPTTTRGPVRDPTTDPTISPKRRPHEHPLVAYFVKKYSGKPLWMRKGPSTSVKKRRIRDQMLMNANEDMGGPRESVQSSRNEEASGPQGSAQPTSIPEGPVQTDGGREKSAEPMDETIDGVATMPPFNLQHMDRWVRYLRSENRVDIPGFARPQTMDTEAECNALRGMISIMELVHMRIQVTRMFDVFEITRRLVSELMQDVVGSDTRYRRMRQDRIADVDTMVNEMNRYMFDIDEITNVGAWLDLNEPPQATARSPSPSKDEEELRWSDEEM